METLVQPIRSLQNRLREGDSLFTAIDGTSLAIWREPRGVRDVDPEILLGREDAERLLAVLAPHYSSLLPDPLRALREQAMLFVQDAAGTRLDLLLADTPYDVQAIRRAQIAEVEPGASISVCSPEDLAIYKLISTRLRDHEDAASVIRRQAESLDDDYILHWLRQFEQALDDSTLVAEYEQLRGRKTSAR